jgi:hypothetical protein
MEFNTIDEISTFNYDSVLEALKKTDGLNNDRTKRVILETTERRLRGEGRDESFRRN